MNHHKLKIIGIFGAIAVAFGALGAHYLKAKAALGIITPDQLLGFETAVKYQIYHTIMLLVIYVLYKQQAHIYLNYAFNLFVIGILLFSGSLYLLCTRNLFNADWLKAVGPITPIGGLFLIAGWACIALIGFKKTIN